MTKKKLWLTAALTALAVPAVLNAQDPAPAPEYGIKFGGFVKFDAFNDSRQVVAARDDMFLLYPNKRVQVTKAPDGITDANMQSLYIFSNKEDMNATGQTGMTAVQSRLSGKITGPDAFGAKVTGLLELDFFGSANYNANMTRLRHAWINLDWGKVAFRAGQDWHPLFLQGGVFPGTLQFNPLAPIHPFGRAPQMAVTFKPVEGLRLSLYALEQSYHADSDVQTTNLITGQPSGRALRNAKRPELAVQGDYTISGFTIGGTYDNKIIVPLNATNAVIATDCDGAAPTTSCPISYTGNNNAQVRTQIYSAYMQFKTGDLKIKASTTWGDNWFSLLGIGGYAMKESVTEANLAALGVPAADVTAYQQSTKRQYSQTKSQAYWGEIAYGKDIEFGVVGGRTVNKGAADEVKTTVATGRNTMDLKEVITVAPRIKVTSGKTMFGLEYIYSAAKYKEDDKNYMATLNYLTTGTYAIPTSVDTLTVSGLTINNDSVINKHGLIGKTYTVTNHRIQFSVQQNF